MISVSCRRTFISLPYAIVVGNDCIDLVILLSLLTIISYLTCIRSLINRTGYQFLFINIKIVIASILLSF